MSEMIIHDELQGSPEWKALRLKHIGASEAAAIMGKSKYMTRMELLHMKSTGETAEVTDSMQYIFDKGHKAEELARPVIEEIIGEELYPVVASREVEGIPFLASTDGAIMTFEVGFEHKLFSEWRAAEVAEKSLTMDVWQLEHQMLVFEHERIYFTVSNLVDKGSKKKKPVYMIYTSDPELRRQLIEGCKLFMQDLAEYVPPEKKEEVAAKEIKELPALRLELSGKVKSGTLKSYAKSAEKYIKEINLELKEDADFVNAELDIKACKKAEDIIKLTKENALSSTVSIKEAMDMLDDLTKQFSTIRKQLKKEVDTKKDTIKTDKINLAMGKLNTAIADASKKTAPFTMHALGYDFYAAIKNKRTLSSIQAAIDTELNDFLIRLKKYENIMLANIALYNELDPSKQTLFADFNDHVMVETSAVKTLIEGRLAVHAQEVEEENKEKERKDAEALAEVQEQQRLADIAAQKEAAAMDTAEAFAEYEPTVLATEVTSTPDPTEFPEEHTAEVHHIDEHHGQMEQTATQAQEHISDFRMAQRKAYVELLAILDQRVRLDNKEIAKVVVSAISEGMINHLKLEV